MRIANWNVERPAIDCPKNAARVNQLLVLDADLVTLTETSRAVDLGQAYSGFFAEPNPRKPGVGEAAAAIWIKNSMFTVVAHLPTSDPREAICLRLESGFGPLIIYSSIIPYHGYKGPDGKSGFWQEHKKAIQWHREDWLALKTTYPDHHLIAAGDYNQHRDGIGRYGSREIRQLLTDALESAELECVTEADFVSTRKLSRRNVDHVCLTKKLAANVTRVDVWEGTTDGIRLSDHNGIFVDIDGRNLSAKV